MKNKKGRGFNPSEIIFCPTSDCNLHCEHCFVTRNNKLDIEDSVRFLLDCVKASGNNVDEISGNGISGDLAGFVPIEKIGFSGGEPFLALDFVCEICRVTVENDLYFDNLMTNGVWWKTEDELKSALARLRDAGFDGKIGLSWDSFHGQSVEKIATFINYVHEIFNDKTAVAIWSVVPNGKEKTDDKTAKEKILELAKMLGGNVNGKTDKKSGCGEIVILGNMNDKTTSSKSGDFGYSDKSRANVGQIGNLYLPIYRFSESKMPKENPEWHDKKWFAEDFCESTGQVLYVHANGKIAPCCGFANECESLIIGTVKDSYKTVMKNARENRLVKICFEDGLSSCIKPMKKAMRNRKMVGANSKSIEKAEQEKEVKFPKGKTNDMCQFCAWVSKINFQ